MKLIRNFFYRIRLRNQKRRALFEAINDIRFIRETRKKDVYYDVSKARRDYAELTKVDEEKQDREKIQALSTQIAITNATLKELQDSEKLRDGLEEYIALI